MKCRIEVNQTLSEDEVVIFATEIDKEILDLKERIENDSPQVLTGFYEDKLSFINPDKIIRVYANDKKVFAVTYEREYLLRLALYQVEERLDNNKFIRISNAEIINLEKTREFDLSYIGTISCEMVNGDVCFVSRRSLKKVKEVLGI